MATPWFNMDRNRSERAFQAEWLVPALRDCSARWRLLSQIEDVSKSESDGAIAMHFVWVLRDAFSFERDAIASCPDAKESDWSDLIRRWVEILDLPSWAKDPSYWIHPEGFRRDSNYVVHPVNKALGWTTNGLKYRYSHLRPPVSEDQATPVLVDARMVLNTECDCFIQSDQRLIVIECKDKTGFTSEQRKRQRELVCCLERLFPRDGPVRHVEVANTKSRKPIDLAMTWETVQDAVNGI